MYKFTLCTQHIHYNKRAKTKILYLQHDNALYIVNNRRIISIFSASIKRRKSINRV
jgi:tRNA threonylcarbamoyladenosine modification (KEOPS) complex Cgi121 subunit